MNEIKFLYFQMFYRSNYSMMKQIAAVLACTFFTSMFFVFVFFIQQKQLNLLNIDCFKV